MKRIVLVVLAIAFMGATGKGCDKVIYPAFLEKYAWTYADDVVPLGKVGAFEAPIHNASNEWAKVGNTLVSPTTLDADAIGLFIPLPNFTEPISITIEGSGGEMICAIDADPYTVALPFGTAVAVTSDYKFTVNTSGGDYDALILQPAYRTISTTITSIRIEATTWLLYANMSFAGQTFITKKDYHDCTVNLLRYGWTPAEIASDFFGDRIVEPWNTTPTDYHLAKYYPGAGFDPGDPLFISDQTGNQFTLVLDGYGPLTWRRDAKWVMRRCGADELSFQYPASKNYASLLHRPQTLSLYDRDGYLVQKFILTAPAIAKRRVNGQPMYDVEAKDLTAILGDSIVRDYPGVEITVQGTLSASATSFDCWTNMPDETTFEDRVIVIDSERIFCESIVVDGDVATVTGATRGYDDTDATEHGEFTPVKIAKSIKEHVESILEYQQEAALEIDIGSVYDGVDGDHVIVDFQNKSVLACVEELWKLSGYLGQWAVLPDEKFYWAERLGGEYQTLATGRELKSIESTVNTENLVTKLHCYGSGLSVYTRPVVTVENNIATYGTVVRHVEFDGVYDPYTLGKFADALIAQFSEPDILYKAVAADRYAMTGETVTLPGTKCRLYDADLDIDTEQEALTVTRMLDDPAQPVEVEFLRNVRTLDGVIDELRRSVTALKNRDIIVDINRGVRRGDVLGVTRVNMEDPRDGDHLYEDSLVKHYFDGEYRNAVSEIVWQDYTGA